MKGHLALMAIAGVAALSAFTLSAQTKSQWDGVYAAEQAKRGEPLYEQHCAACHGTDLAGGQMAPGLSGGEFAMNWEDLTLGDLFERIRISMPQNAPGSLSAKEYGELLAFILEKNGYPAGSAELPTTVEPLNAYKFRAKKP
jgi:mono/diheme cytochrome c family protein